ncbi:MAG: UTP--glucose-1-phosphate uridylyltransferase [Hydrogenophilales bacterium 17-61-76]|nr:MAG: UTP--glucose-1-phosphate uridylyltransferase [Hydrogenophilales bacterium 17-61-76]
MQIVRKAVFPVAGLGTRFLPATKASPKEMLPIVDKPLIQYAVEEAMDAGITDIIFISSRTKRTVEDHFDKAYELETELEARGKKRVLELVQSIRPAGVNFIYIRQAEALGLGHAVLCAQPVVGNEPFAASYGIVDATPMAERVSRVNAIVEKPQPEDAPSNLGVVGRYILTPRIFHHIQELKPGAGGELQLTDAIAALLKEQQVLAYAFDGVRYDCGSKLGYLQATVEYALKHPEVSEEFGAYLKKRMC